MSIRSLSLPRPPPKTRIKCFLGYHSWTVMFRGLVRGCKNLECHAFQSFNARTLRWEKVKDAKVPR